MAELQLPRKKVVEQFAQHTSRLRHFSRPSYRHPFAENEQEAELWRQEDRNQIQLLQTLAISIGGVDMWLDIVGREKELAEEKYGK
jgi:hypothetical protein